MTTGEIKMKRGHAIHYKVKEDHRYVTKAAYTIYVRRSEFAVLRSIGMTTKELNRMLLLEAALYGIKALVLALPISLAIHYILYYLISTGMTPFVFYLKGGVYVIAIAAVCLIVISAMLFSVRSIKKVEIVKQLKMGSI